MNILETLRIKRENAVRKRKGLPPLEAGDPKEAPALNGEYQTAGQAQTAPAQDPNRPSPKVFERQISWETTEIELVRKSEAKAWRCAKLVSVVSLGLTCAIIAMMPLKQALPFVIKVDQSTGMTDIVDIATEKSVPRSEIMDRYWLSEYVKARESYDWRTVDLEYDRVRELSMPNIFEDYAKHHGDRPGTMEVDLKDAKVIRIDLVSIIPAGNGIATVRFVKRTLVTKGFTEEKREYLQATIGYEYDPTYIVSERRRLINPFGFKVTSYRTDKEMR